MFGVKVQFVDGFSRVITFLITTRRDSVQEAINKTTKFLKQSKEDYPFAKIIDLEYRGKIDA